MGLIIWVEWHLLNIQPSSIRIEVTPVPACACLFSSIPDDGFPYPRLEMCHRGWFWLMMR